MRCTRCSNSDDAGGAGRAITCLAGAGGDVNADESADRPPMKMPAMTNVQMNTPDTVTSPAPSVNAAPAFIICQNDGRRTLSSPGWSVVSSIAVLHSEL